MAGQRTAPVRSRPQLLQAGIDAFSQPDVRNKVLFALGMLIIFRFVAHVPVPGVEREALQRTFDNNAILGFLNIFSGGALQNLSVAALGVYPYITAQIVMQLATPLVPRLQALSQEGESGRNRISLYTTWLTVPLAAFQGYAQLLLIQQLGGISDIGFTGGNALPTVATLFSLVAGTMFLVWLGELISERGIGNGISLLILGGIVAGLPGIIGRRSSTRGRRSAGGACTASRGSRTCRCA
jgi:preprotein translocase subunit SecY